MHQLTCNGVLEGIPICRKGFPNRQVHVDFKIRYSILAPEAAKKEDNKEASAGIMKVVVKGGRLTEEDFRIGHTKVFFKAGILARMEDLRDEKLSETMMGIQTEIRWFCARKEYWQRWSQLNSYVVVQKNIRNWSVLRTWDWYLLYGKIRPMLGQTEKEIARCEERIKEVDALIASNVGMNELKEKNEGLMKRSEEVSARLEEQRTNANAARDRAAALKRDADKLEAEAMELKSVVEGLESKNADAQSVGNAVSAEAGGMASALADMEAALKKAEEEKAKREEAISKNQHDKAAADDEIMKLSRDIKDLSKTNSRYQDEIQAADDKTHRFQRESNNLSRRLNDIEDSMDRDSRSRSDAESQGSHLQDNLKAALEKIDALTGQVQDAEARLKEKEREVANANTRLKDENSRCLRLEHQLIDLATAATGMSRPYQH